MLVFRKIFSKTQMLVLLSAYAIMAHAFMYGLAEGPSAATIGERQSRLKAKCAGAIGEEDFVERIMQWVAEKHCPCGYNDQYEKYPCTLSLIHNAAHGEWQEVERMLEQGANPCEVDKEGKSLFSYCYPWRWGVEKLTGEPVWGYIRLGDRPASKWASFLHDKGVKLTHADVFDEQEKVRVRPCGREARDRSSKRCGYPMPQSSWLHRAAYHCPDLIPECVALKIPVDQRNECDETPLFYCIRKTLCHRRCSNKAERTEISDVRVQKTCKAIALLIQHGADKDVLCKSPTLLQTYMRLDLKDISGGAINPLFAALCARDEAIAYKLVKALLNAGADPNHTPLIASYAGAHSSDRIVARLLAAGMKWPGYSMPYGTALAAAVMRSHDDTECCARVYKLLLAGVPPDACALINAALAGKDDYVGLFLAHGVSPDEIAPKHVYGQGMQYLLQEGTVSKLYDTTYHCKNVFIEALLQKARACPQLFKNNLKALYTQHQKNERYYNQSAAHHTCIDTFTCATLPSHIVDAYSALANEPNDEHLKHTWQTLLHFVQSQEKEEQKSCYMRWLVRRALAEPYAIKPLFIKAIDPSHIFETHTARCFSVCFDDDEIADGIALLVARACRAQSQEDRIACQELFEYYMLHKPDDWKPGWCHFEQAIHAARKGMLSFLKSFAACGDINAYGLTHQTPLHYALDSHYLSAEVVQAVEVLLNAGANVKAVDVSHAFGTALHQAIHQSAKNPGTQSKKLKLLLLAYGADMQQENAYGLTPAQLEEIYDQAARMTAV